MKFNFWCIVVLVSIHTRQVLAKEYDEVMKEEQWLEHTQRDEVVRDLQARIIDGDRAPIDAYVSNFVQKKGALITFAVKKSCC
jgi:hypothetical protein